MTVTLNDVEDRCPICGSTDLVQTQLGVVCKSCKYDWPYEEKERGN